MDNNLKLLAKELLYKTYEGEKNIYNLYSGGLSPEFNDIEDDDLFKAADSLKLNQLVSEYNKHCIQLNGNGLRVINEYKGDIDKYLKHQKKILQAQEELLVLQVKEIKRTKIFSIIAVIISFIGLGISLLTLLK